MKISIKTVKKLLESSFAPGEYEGFLSGFETSDGGTYDVVFKFSYDEPEPSNGYGGGVVGTNVISAVSLGEMGESGDVELSPEEFLASLTSLDRNNLDHAMISSAEKQIDQETWGRF